MIIKKGMGFSFDCMISLRAIILYCCDFSEMPLILSWKAVGIVVNNEVELVVAIDWLGLGSSGGRCWFAGFVVAAGSGAFDDC